MTTVTHHVIIDQKEVNNLRLLPHSEYVILSETTTVCEGDYDYCCNFKNKFTEEIPYPLCDMEEEY